MNDLIGGIADALAGDAAIAAWADGEYGRPCAVFENIDLRSPPDEEDCPLVIVHPASKEAGLRDKRSHGISVTVLVFDDHRVAEASGVIRYTGPRQAEALRLLALTAILGSIPSGCRIDSVAVEYDTIEQFPFCWIDMVLTVVQENTLGRGMSVYD
jgi:hypothetical protein